MGSEQLIDFLEFKIAERILPLPLGGSCTIFWCFPLELIIMGFVKVHVFLFDTWNSSRHWLSHESLKNILWFLYGSLGHILGISFCLLIEGWFSRYPWRHTVSESVSHGDCPIKFLYNKIE